MKAEERCQEHMVADGEIVRSIKKNGLVERTRRCGECKSLFRTFEMTDDKVASERAEQDSLVMGLRRELEYYKGLARRVGQLHELERELAEELRGEYA